MKTKTAIFLAMILLVTLCSIAGAKKPEGPEEEQDTFAASALIDAFFTHRTGDLPEMLALQKIRVLVTPNRSTYFLDKAGQPRGLDYELLNRYGKFLNRKRKKGTLPVSIIFIPVTIAELGDALLDGRGDIAGITLLTPKRSKEFAYTDPVFDQVNEVLVTRKGGPEISKLEDLAGKTVHVVDGSAQMEGMARLNERLKIAGLKSVKVIKAKPYVAYENLLEMINGGFISAAVVPDVLANLWKGVFKDLMIHERIPVSKGMKAGWAVRKSNPELLHSMNEAIRTALKKDKNVFEKKFKQYFKRTHWISNPFTKGSKFNLATHFQREAGAFGMDWIQIMAQGFQESALNQKAKSPYGAVGIMQVLPSTAESLGIKNYMKLEGNIRAGVKYMDKLMKRFAKDPGINRENRFFLTLASYNAGPGRVNGYRKRAKKMGYDPNIWFGNVERVALRSGNLETVMYVRNIMNYTMAYKSAYDRYVQARKMRVKQGLQ